MSVFLVRNSLPSIRIISPEPRPLYVHLLDIHTCSLGGEGQGTFAYPPPLFTSPSPSPLTCGWWLQLQCLQSAINAAANRFRAPRPLEMLMFRTSLSLSLACRGRFGLVWASYPPEKLKSEKICSNTKKKILFYSSSSIAMVKFFFPHFPSGPGVIAALSTQAWPWAGLGPHVPA